MATSDPKPLEQLHVEAIPYKLFVLGATGYLGGTILQKFTAKHPTVQITAIARSEKKAEEVKKAFPGTNIVIGDFDSSDVIAEEARKADIVLSCSSADHEGQMKAIYKGMAKHGKQAFLIHTSGTGVLTDPHTKKPGEKYQTEISDKTWDDIKDIDAIHKLPDENLHRPVDRIVLEQCPPNVKAAIIAPPTIYGRGTGLKAFSHQVPNLIHATLELGSAFQCGEGENVFSNVHVLDLAELYIILLESAMAGGRDVRGEAEKLQGSSSGTSVDWGYEGYYFAENGSHKWGEISSLIGAICFELGLLKDAGVRKLDRDQVKKISEGGNYSWGANSKSRASRARKFGWSPKATRLEETVVEEVKNNKTDLPLETKDGEGGIIQGVLDKAKEVIGL